MIDTLWGYFGCYTACNICESVGSENFLVLTFANPELVRCMCREYVTSVSNGEIHVFFLHQSFHYNVQYTLYVLYSSLVSLTLSLVIYMIILEMQERVKYYL